MKTITLQDIKVYLHVHEWKCKDFPSMNVIVCVPPKKYNSSQMVYIPINYDSRLEDIEVENVIFSIKEIVKSDQDTLKKEILTLSKDPVDILSFRLASELISEGNIPLSIGTAAINNLKDTIKESIRFEYNSRVLSKKVKLTKEIFESHMDNFVLGQTQKGSYIFNIQTQAFPTTQNPDIQMEGLEQVYDPIERQVLERIQYTLEQIETASLYRNIDKGIEYVLDKRKNNAINEYIIGDINNILDVHEEVAKRKNIHTGIVLESKLHFSPMYPGRNAQFSTKEKVQISNKSYQLIKELNSCIKVPQLSMSEKVNLTGKIIGMRVNTNKKKSNYMASIDVEVYGYKANQIKVNISSQYYMTVLKALENQSYIEISGIMKEHKPNSKWEIGELINLSLAKM